MERPRPLPSILSANGALLAGLVLLGGLAQGGCRGEARPSSSASPAAAASGDPSRSSVAPAGSTDGRPVVLCLGTSLTAGYGLDPEEAYPALLQAKVDAAGLRYRVVNAGVSGETSAGARRRMGWLMRQPVSVLVVETGANDGLRGQAPEATRENVQAILDEARRQQPPPRLVLVGMEALPNYGEEYRRRFRAIYPDLAKRNGAALVPFLLDGVAGDPRLNQADGIHPTAEGQKVVAANVWRVLRPLLAPGH
ncbi:MAG TPA: arylesterase [Vicinamibacteria bacterium]|nr:arylesterase [Vicinamibacteria bacterium]